VDFIAKSNHKVSSTEPVHVTAAVIFSDETGLPSIISLALPLPSFPPQSRHHNKGEFEFASTIICRDENVSFLTQASTKRIALGPNPRFGIPRLSLPTWAAKATISLPPPNTFRSAE
jgi:hypothetical protein